MSRKPPTRVRGLCLAVGVSLVSRTHAQACAGPLEETWKAALSLAGSAEPLRLGQELAWSEWSRAWLPLAQQVVQDLEGSLAECPEGSVAAWAHGLLALDEVQGRATVLQTIKMMHHTLSDQTPPDAALQPSQWQQHWLLAVSSLIRFLYLKWVNIPQDNDLPDEVAQGPRFSPGLLRRHQEFLFRSFVGDFVASGVYDLEMTENSVLFSEAFAFVSFCHMHQVDFIAESGVYKGVSTEIWSLFAQKVAAVDIFLAPEAEARLQKRKNVRLYTGDGRSLLPELLAETRKAAVFIDGPKGELAIHLALSLQKLPQVAFVAMHDMGPYRRELKRLGAFFFSDEEWFQATYGHLDAPFLQRPDLEAGGTMAFLPGTDA